MRPSRARPPLPAVALAVALVSFASAWPSPALAGTPEECIAASDRAQAKRDDGHLLDSRVDFVACADDSCPAIVKRECLRWLADVDERTPSILVSVKERSGKDIVTAEVTVDGVPIARDARGRALPLDPGAHLVRATIPGREPVQESLIARERERSRVVTLLARPLEPAPDTAPGAAARGRPVPVLSWILGGVAVAGLGTFAVVWAEGVDHVATLRSTCAPYCSAERIDDARTPLTVARVALGVGIAAGLGAVAVYLLRPSGERRSASGAPLLLSF